MSDDVDFGNAADPTPAPAREAADLGAGTDFGSVLEQPETAEITLAKQQHEAQMARVKFDKNFQLSVLAILIATVALLMGYDLLVTFFGGSSHFQTVLTVIMPVFTFLLGMGTQTGESNKP